MIIFAMKLLILMLTIPSSKAKRPNPFLVHNKARDITTTTLATTPTEPQPVFAEDLTTPPIIFSETMPYPYRQKSDFKHAKNTDTKSTEDPENYFASIQTQLHLRDNAYSPEKLALYQSPYRFMKPIAIQPYQMSIPQSENLQQNFPQGLPESIPQGLQQGCQQGMQQGCQQGMQQSLQQAIPPNLQQGMPQGIPQELPQSYLPGNNLQQGVQRDFMSRGFDRNPLDPRGQVQAYPKSLPLLVVKVPVYIPKPYPVQYIPKYDLQQQYVKMNQMKGIPMCYNMPWCYNRAGPYAGNPQNMQNLQSVPGMQRMPGMQGMQNNVPKFPVVQNNVPKMQNMQSIQKSPRVRNFQDLPTSTTVY